MKLLLSDEENYTVKSLAEELNKNPSTVYGLLDSGKIKAEKVGKTMYFISKDAVKDYLSKEGYEFA